MSGPAPLPALDCRVYWASHGCHKRRNHPGKHQCDCGDVLVDWMPTYGEDALEGVDPRAVKGDPPPGWGPANSPPGRMS